MPIYTFLKAEYMENHILNFISIYYLLILNSYNQ